MAIRPILPRGPLFNYGRFYGAAVKAVSDTVKDGQAQMQDYPPQLPSVTPYRRTGTLRRSWSSGVTPSQERIVGITGSSSNIAPYNRQVQGKDQTQFFDVRGWPDVNDLKKEATKKLTRRFKRAVKSGIERKP